MKLRFESIATLSSLRYRNFRLLFFGTILSHTGDFMQAMAQSWLVWDLTRSTFILGIVGFCQAAPRLLFGAVGGVIVDRVDSRRLLLFTQVLAMIQSFIFWFLVYFNYIHFSHILLLVIFLGAVNSLNQTSRQTLVNAMVPRGDLLNAVALNSAIVNMSKVVGPSLGGVLISVIGVDGCLLINAISFLAIIFSVLAMDVPARRRSKQKQDFLREVREGYQYARTNRHVFSALVITYVVGMIGAPFVRFLPVFATDILHVGASGLGLLMSAPAVGAVASGLLLASISQLRRRRTALFISVMTFSIFLVIFAFSRSMTLSLIVLVLSGASQMAFRALANTIVQMETPSHLLGRTLSLLLMDRGLWSFGTLLIGSIASLVGTPWAIAWSGIICGASATAALYARERSVARELQKEPAEDSMTPKPEPTVEP
jgi:MFS transporter, DHA1 family, staphyloferrin A biosynthesis exporter